MADWSSIYYAAVFLFCLDAGKSVVLSVLSPLCLISSLLPSFIEMGFLNLSQKPDFAGVASISLREMQLNLVSGTTLTLNQRWC